MKNIYLIALFIASSAFADHNSHLEGYDPDRGYNRSNCLSLQSKTTNKQAEWLGHHVGCMVEDGNGYVLIMEYKVQELSKDMGDDLRDLVKEYENKNASRIPMNLREPKNIYDFYEIMEHHRIMNKFKAFEKEWVK